MLGYTTSQPQAFYTNSETASRSILADSPLKIPLERLVTRIGSTNIPSRRLFEKLGFQISKRVEIFDEIEMKYCRSRSEKDLDR